MSNERKIGLDALQSVGSSSNELFQNQEAFIRDTAFISPSTLLSDMDFFDNSGKDAMWKSKDFPSGTMAYKITHVEVDPQVTFNANQVVNFKIFHYFLQNSYLQWRDEGDDVFSIPLAELVPYRVVPTTNSDVNSGVVNRHSDLANKFNNMYQLKKPLEVAANKRPDVRIIVAKACTTAAYSANYSPYMSQSGLTNNEGFYIMVKFAGTKSKVNR